MEKILISEDGIDEVIHYINCKFIDANKTLCGERLHPINTIHIHALPVTCKKCLKLVGETDVSLRSFEINPQSLKDARNLIKRSAELTICLQAKVCPVCTKELTTGLSGNGTGILYTCSNCAFSLVRNK